MSETEQNIIEVQPNGSEGKSDQQPSPEKSQKDAGKSGRGLAVLAILIAAGSLGFSGYIGWQGKNLRQEVQQNQPVFSAGIEQLQSQIARQQARVTDVVTGVKPLQNDVDELQGREQRLVERMDTVSRRIKDLEGGSRDQWRLAEVEYLMRLANQRLLMGTDVASSRNLLQSADNILQELDDYSLFPIREALAEDMAMIRATGDFDQESTYLRLQALSSLIPQLKLLEEQRLTLSPEKVAAASEFTPEATSWPDKAKAMLMDTWQQFTNLFRINTQREKPVEALLSVEQEMLIRQNLRLMLEQAKLAVLTREPEIYRSSVEQAREWLNYYFTLGGEVTQSMTTELEALENLNISPNLPTINRSLEALKSYQSNLESPIPEPAPQQNTTTEAQQSEANIPIKLAPEQPVEPVPEQPALKQSTPEQPAQTPVTETQVEEDPEL